MNMAGAIPGMKYDISTLRKHIKNTLMYYITYIS